MRQIKFRGKRLGTQEWVEGYYWHNIQDDRHNIVISIPVKGLVSGQMQENARVDDETIGQFTGLTDKNGKEIFEGDIVRKMGIAYTITLNNLHAMWGLFTKYGQSNEEILCDTTDENGNICKFWQDSSLTVIGNIHDNPELIK